MYAVRCTLKNQQSTLAWKIITLKMKHNHFPFNGVYKLGVYIFTSQCL